MEKIKAELEQVSPRDYAPIVSPKGSSVGGGENFTPAPQVVRRMTTTAVGVKGGKIDLARNKEMHSVVNKFQSGLLQMVSEKQKRVLKFAQTQAFGTPADQSPLGKIKPNQINLFQGGRPNLSILKKQSTILSPRDSTQSPGPGMKAVPSKSQSPFVSKP